MTDRPIRASDKERESVVDVLRDAYTDGRLTLEEFDERTSSAYASKTWADLRELTADLPVEPVLGADLPQRHLAQQPAARQVVPSVPRPRHGGRDRPLGVAAGHLRLDHDRGGSRIAGYRGRAVGGVHRPAGVPGRLRRTLKNRQ